MAGGLSYASCTKHVAAALFTVVVYRLSVVATVAAYGLDCWKEKRTYIIKMKVTETSYVQVDVRCAIRVNRIGE